MQDETQKTIASGSGVIPVECFLHRIFPPGFYKDETDRIVRERLFKPRKDCEEISLNFPLDWEARDKAEDRNWRMQLQGWAVFQPVMNFFDTYEDKDAVLEFFFGLVADWWANYGDDPTDIVTSRMPDSYAWYDMSVGFRALIIAFFANRITAFGLELSPGRKELLEQIGRKHIANLANPKTFSLNNHGVFQAQGLMALLQTFSQDEAFSDHKTYALALMERLVRSQFDARGFHREHSPHYHFYVLATFEAVIKSGWFDTSTVIMSRIEAAEAACKWLVDPLRRPICVGDSILTVQKSVTFPESQRKPYLMSNFDKTGYAALRSDWGVPAEQATMVFLMGAYHDKTHKHRDCLSFDWFDQGRRIICDGGKYGYKSDKYRHYALSYKAHNTAEIDGFDILKVKPYGSAILPTRSLSSGFYRLQGTLDFPAVKQARSIFVNPGRWLIARDKLEYMRQRKATLWFHLETDFRLVWAKGSSALAQAADGFTVSIDCLTPEAELEIQYGNEAEMKGFVSAKDYEISPAVTAGFTVNGKKHSVCTVFALDAEARHQALLFAEEHLGAKIGHLPTPRPAPKNILPNVQHLTFSAPSKIQLKPGTHTYKVPSEGTEIAFFLDHKNKQEGPKKLLIMLPGASARKNGHMDFQRYGWSGDFPDHDVAAFTDPSLKPDNTLGLAWFQHSESIYGITAMTTLIRHMIERGEYDEQNVTLFGSSGGGFSVLQLANAFPKAKVIAINPQIFLYNYSPTHYNAMLETCYPGLTDAQVRKQYLDRITVQLSPQKREAPTYIFQNIHDVSHLERHLKPFIGRLDEADVTTTDEHPAETLNKLNVVLFDDPNSGHAPPNREKTVQMLLPVL